MKLLLFKRHLNPKLQQMIEEVKSQVGAEGRGDVQGVRAEIAKILTEFMACLSR
jgi:hypothetical protein